MLIAIFFSGTPTPFDIYLPSGGQDLSQMSVDQLDCSVANNDAQRSMLTNEATRSAQRSAQRPIITSTKDKVDASKLNDIQVIATLNSGN